MNRKQQTICRLLPAVGGVFYFRRSADHLGVARVRSCFSNRHRCPVPTRWRRNPGALGVWLKKDRSERGENSSVQFWSLTQCNQSRCAMSVFAGICSGKAEGVFTEGVFLGR